MRRLFPLLLICLTASPAFASTQGVLGHSITTVLVGIVLSPVILYFLLSGNGKSRMAGALAGFAAFFPLVICVLVIFEDHSYGTAHVALLLSALLSLFVAFRVNTRVMTRVTREAEDQKVQSKLKSDTESQAPLVSRARLFLACTVASAAGAAGLTAIWLAAAFVFETLAKKYGLTVPKAEWIAMAFAFLVIWSYDLLRRARVERRQEWPKLRRFPACWDEACTLMDASAATYAFYCLIVMCWIVAFLYFAVMLLGVIVFLLGFGSSGGKLLDGLLAFIPNAFTAVVAPVAAFAGLPRVLTALAIYLAAVWPPAGSKGSA